MAVHEEGVRRVKMTCGALTGVEVLRISLVDRGANRVPFRFTKRDGAPEGGNVIDISKFLRGKDEVKKTELAEIAGIVISADVDLETAKATIEKAGFSVENLVETQDGHRLFIQGDTKELNVDDCQFIKFDNHRGVFVKGAGEVLKRASLDFGENLGAQQFIPSMFLAHDALANTISNILVEADTQETAVTAIKTAAKKFSEHVGSLADQIPKDVFKLEAAFDVAPEAEPKVEKAKDKPEATAAKKGEDEPTKTKDKPEGDVKKGEDDDTAKTSDPEGQVKKSDPEQDGGESAILKAIEGVNEKLVALAGQVDEVTKTAEEAKQLALKADKSSTALGGPDAGDPEPELRFEQGDKVQKSEGGPALLDTAYNRPKDD